MSHINRLNINMYLRQRSCKYGACTTETSFRILLGEGIAMEKITPRIDRVPLMHNLVDPNHKEFVALPPNLVYHTLTHIVIQHQNPMLLNPGCMQDAWAPHSIAWSWFSTHEPHQYRHRHAAGLCHWIYPYVCTWLLYRAVEMCGSNSWHWLCYKI